MELTELQYQTEQRGSSYFEKLPRFCLVTFVVRVCGKIPPKDIVESDDPDKKALRERTAN
jgi:hypothetical protein